MIFLVYSLQKFILIYLPMIQTYIFITHLRLNDLFYKNNINLFSQWANKWQLNISLSKCAVITLGKVTPSTYFINNIQLENVTFYKDL